jgi:hypothetical protein
MNRVGFGIRNEAGIAEIESMIRSTLWIQKQVSNPPTQPQLLRSPVMSRPYCSPLPQSSMSTRTVAGFGGKDELEGKLAVDCSEASNSGRSNYQCTPTPSTNCATELLPMMTSLQSCPVVVQHDGQVVIHKAPDPIVVNQVPNGTHMKPDETGEEDNDRASKWRRAGAPHGIGEEKACFARSLRGAALHNDQICI